MEEEKKPKQKGKLVWVSLNFYELMKKQKEKVREATYNCVTPSDTEVTEIIAKKVINSKLL